MTARGRGQSIYIHTHIYICDERCGAESRGNGARPVELMIMNDMYKQESRNVVIHLKFIFIIMQEISSQIRILHSNPWVTALRFAMTRGWVNKDIFIFRWTTPLNCSPNLQCKEMLNKRHSHHMMTLSVIMQIAILFGWKLINHVNASVRVCVCVVLRLVVGYSVQRIIVLHEIKRWRNAEHFH